MPQLTPELLSEIIADVVGPLVRRVEALEQRADAPTTEALARTLDPVVRDAASAQTRSELAAITTALARKLIATQESA